jgi:hypothetical protein
MEFDEQTAGLLLAIVDAQREADTHELGERVALALHHQHGEADWPA